MNSLTKKEHKELGLKVGPTWQSFEKFRACGAEALESIKDGIICLGHKLPSKHMFDFTH
jgi:hypothetical protein